MCSALYSPDRSASAQSRSFDQYKTALMDCAELDQLTGGPCIRLPPAAIEQQALDLRPAGPLFAET
jgi:hypothetical protein